MSNFQLGKTDPANRIFIKTFNQFTNQIYAQNEKPNEFLEQFNTKPLSKDLLKNNILIFSKDHTGHLN